jgi:cytochrome c551/c552
MNWKTWDTFWIYLFGIGMLALTGYLYWNQLMPEWKGYQSEFHDLVDKRFGEQRAATTPAGIQQVWVKELNRTDRCTTCHQGIEWKGLENAPNPFRTHPKEILDKHPVSKYGCTVCHGGQGYATTAAEAHAIDAEHWERPLLGTELAKAYLVSNRHALLESNCNICHRNDRETKGTDYVNYAKQLVRDKGCRACHTINNRGGVIGPNLTYIGDQNPEQYDYARMPGKPSVFGWHLAHFKDPKSMSSETVMPNFGLGSREAQSLAMLVMSWKKTDLPIEYIPGAKTADLPTPEEKAKEEQMLHGEGAFFVRKTCFICHDVTVLGVESATKIGPDLSIAYADVQSRFGRTLDDFLHNPTGTMAVVLSIQIHLTDQERNEAIRTLTSAYQKKQALEAKKPGAKK